MKPSCQIKIGQQHITVSNPEKLLWYDPPISKLEYIHKLSLLSPYLLTYTKNRYLTTIRFPDGIDGEHFYQKNCPRATPDYVQTSVRNGINYVELNTLPTLIWLANLACLEFHPSFEYVGSDVPAEWVIDIDPSMPQEPRLIEAVQIVGELLESLHIESVPKTSGATGMQIFIPIERRYSFEQLRGLSQLIGQYLVKKHPDLFTLERLIKHRKNRIYIDYLQHWHGKTLSAPYTPRARVQAPVSTPLRWQELHPSLQPQDFNLLNIEQRLQSSGDLIAAVPLQSLDHLLESIHRL